MLRKLINPLTRQALPRFFNRVMNSPKVKPTIAIKSTPATRLFTVSRDKFFEKKYESSSAVPDSVWKLGEEALEASNNLRNLRFNYNVLKQMSHQLHTLDNSKLSLKKLQLSSDWKTFVEVNKDANKIIQSEVDAELGEIARQAIGRASSLAMLEEADNLMCIVSSRNFTERFFDVAANWQETFIKVFQTKKELSDDAVVALFNITTLLRKYYIQLHKLIPSANEWTLDFDVDERTYAFRRSTEEAKFFSHSIKPLDLQKTQEIENIQSQIHKLKGQLESLKKLNPILEPFSKDVIGCLEDLISCKNNNIGPGGYESLIDHFWNLQVNIDEVIYTTTVGLSNNPSAQVLIETCNSFWKDKDIIDDVKITPMKP